MDKITGRNIKVINEMVSGGQIVWNEEFLDYAGLCAFLKISRGTARNWKSQGKLPFTMFCGKVLFPRREILKILKKNNIHATQVYFEEFTEKQDAQLNQNGGENE